MGLFYLLIPKTVVLAGVGIYYVRETANSMFGVARNMPFPSSMAQEADALTPNERWASPFPALGISTLAPAWFWKGPNSYVPRCPFTVHCELTHKRPVDATPSSGRVPDSI